MIISKIYALLLLILLTGCTVKMKESPPSESLVIKNFTFAEKQTEKMLQTIGDSDKNPRNTEEDGSLRLVASSDWTSGFFPGNLWHLYEFTGDEEWKNAAQEFTGNVKDQQWNDGTHDMGFKMYCSFGNGLRLTQNQEYKKILLQSARTLITRFNPTVGAIRSWDHNSDKWQYPVIIDNMMNLELLFWATKASGDPTFYDIAKSHATTTLRNHFREDFSSYHVLNYDTLTGEVLNKHTHQGYSHESAWARGQAWGLYGFTMCYRETGHEPFLDQAKKIAAYLLNHSKMPDDLIPYWDFDDPAIPNATRDASAAAIMASALYELSSYVKEEKSRFLGTADKILNSLSSDRYRAQIGKNNYFLLTHSTGNLPKNSEIDVPIIYADYYFLEANLRKWELEMEKTLNLVSE